MEPMEKYCLVMTTCESAEDAQTLARTLLEKRLAACIQVSQVNSFYEWKGQVQTDPEYLLLIKSKTDRYWELEQALVDVHPYEVPEIVQLPIQNGLSAYLGWMDQVCKS